MKRSVWPLIVSAVCLWGGLWSPVTAQEPIYVNIFWNQHQPSYVHALTGRFEYPFTRIHAMRDYYFMAAVLIDGRNPFNKYELRGNEWVDTGQPTGFGFPFVHLTINLSGILLNQLNYYVESLAPCFDGAETAADCNFDAYPNGNPLDPEWNDNSILFERVFDLLVKPQANFTQQEKVFLLFNSSWLTPREHHVFLYPSYAALENKRLGPGGGNPDNWTEEELRDFKIWYALSAFHSYFKETDRYVLRGLDEEGREITDTVDGIKSLGGFKTWGTPEDEWFGEHGETLDPMDMGGYSQGSGAPFIEVDGTPARHFTDEDAIHIALQIYKIMKFVIPIHRKLQNTICPHTGYPQIEVVTTPYSHPILPLLYDTDTFLDGADYYGWSDPNYARSAAVDFAYHGDGEAAQGQFGPGDPVIYDDDVYNQVALGVQQYFQNFQRYPQGMWPGEGAVGESVIYAFRRNGVKWIASGNETCERSGYFQGTSQIYRVDEDDRYLDGDDSDAISAWFRTGSDVIAFDGGFYTNACGWACDGDSWAQRVMEEIRNPAWRGGMWSHTADGENAWGHFHRFGATFFEYAHLPGGVESFGLYYRLNRANALIPEEDRWYVEDNIQTVTPSAAIGIRDGEYVPGAPFPLESQPELEPLFHGSWVNGDLFTWLGEDNEIQAWIDLEQTRADLEAIGAAAWRPHPYEPPVELGPDTREDYYRYMMWMELYAVEGSDPFWWYGADQSFGSDEIFDDLFRERLVNIYVYAQKAGHDMRYPYMQVHPIISPGDNVNNHHPYDPADPFHQPPEECPDGFATCDEDYLYDQSPPPGHGDPILVPPLTRDPTVSPAELPADGSTAGVITVRVLEDPIETSRIDEVSVDLGPLGIRTPLILRDDGDLVGQGDMYPGDEIYSGIVRVPRRVAEGVYRLTITARDTDGAYSTDYVWLTVVPGGVPQGTPRVLMAGLWDTRLSRSQGGALTVAAYVEDGTGGLSTSRVMVYYAGRLGQPLDPPAPMFELGDDGTGGDRTAGDLLYTATLTMSPGMPEDRYLLVIIPEDAHGDPGPSWPLLVVD
jgi:alpha-amylase/alpha-mannosidase (GH57 family)